jgi:prevent-host-death family protein
LHQHPNSSKLTSFSLLEANMRTINIHEAKTHLSRLVDQAAAGEPFVIAKAGKPMVRVTPLDAPTRQEMRRLGFLAGEIAVPEDFDRMGGEEIAELFGAP